MRRFVALLVLENFSVTNGGTNITEDLENPCVQTPVGTDRDTWLVDFMSTKEDIFGSICTEVKIGIRAFFSLLGPISSVGEDSLYNVLRK